MLPTMLLTQNNFPSVINSSDASIVDVFLQPALATSVRYDRGVGYFSAGWLSMIVEGMMQFASHDGQARIITSPILSEDDWLAMQKGIDARGNDILMRALEPTLEDLRKTLSRDARAALAWLVADSVLTFKLAVPVNKLSGEFHAKFGIFTDIQGNKISFEGSNNETINGTIHNYESFKIFCSWIPAFTSIVEADDQRFERLWNNQDPNLRVYNLPEASRQGIIRIRDEDDERPYPLPNRLRAYYNSYSTPSLWKHQQDAIEAWEINNRIGILSMATGSGKTRTSLAAAERCPELAMLVVAVPRSNLVIQWADEIKEHTSFTGVILVFENSEQWQQKLFNQILAAQNAEWMAPVVVVGTMHSLSSPRFLSVIEDAKIPARTLLIVDEVHNVGSPSFRQILRTEFQWRLGLSATPERKYDEVGSGAIEQYFQGVVYTYTMAQALADGNLTPYEYHVYPAYLSDSEFEEYQNLTRKITGLRNRSSNDPTSTQTNNRVDGDNDDLERLLFQRANILKRCTSKIDVIDAVLNDLSLHRCLIYCADMMQLNDMSILLNTKQIIHLQYTASTPLKQRQEALKAIANNEVPVLLAIDCLDEGVDVPVVDQAIILASSSNKRQFIQRRGRVLRKAEGKRYATLVDVIALPPESAGFDARNMLHSELKRATEMAYLANNRHSTLLNIERYVQPYGVLMTELLNGGSDG